ncbi:MAG: helix-turn-helix domain-containing protein [Algicola sp.]|nr:helix-turn-helix domain-containing protein [Algicola sp.]
MSMKDNAKAKHKKMGAELKNIRQEKGLTMRAMAELLGTPHSFIGKIEQQDRRLDIAELEIYCNALGVDPVETYAKLIAL